MQRPVSMYDQTGASCPLANLAVQYVGADSAPESLRALLGAPDEILAIIGFGARRPGFWPESRAFVTAPLTFPAGGQMYEVWTTTAPCRPFTHGPVSGARNEDFLFGAVTLDEPASPSLEAASEAAYLHIFDFLDAAGFEAPLRIWNYLHNITQDENGLERYRRFNIGRHQAFAARLRQSLPPVASGVGGRQGASVIYFLAAHNPARNIENPRQVSAYAYPQVYGPKSPNFARASLHRGKMFISGTASIVGHESRHIGDLQGQIGETIANLRALSGAAAQPIEAGDWAFKIYLHDPAGRDVTDAAITAAFGPACQRLYLQGDLCRRELMVEVEAFRHALATGDSE